MVVSFEPIICSVLRIGLIIIQIYMYVEREWVCSLMDWLVSFGSQTEYASLCAPHRVDLTWYIFGCHLSYTCATEPKNYEGEKLNYCKHFVVIDASLT